MTVLVLALVLVDLLAEEEEAEEDANFILCWLLLLFVRVILASYLVAAVAANYCIVDR